MSIDLSKEEALTLAQAAARLPGRKGQHPHPATVGRWCERGIRGVRLESIAVGGTVFTSAEALGRFLARLNPARGKRSKSEKRRERDEATARKLAELGL